MRIESSDQIEGIPLARIRSMFRRAGLESTLTLDFVGQQLELTKQDAKRLVTGLRTAGFIKPARLRAGFPSDRRQWHLTDEGVRLRLCDGGQAPASGDCRVPACQTSRTNRDPERR